MTTEDLLGEESFSFNVLLEFINKISGPMFVWTCSLAMPYHTVYASLLLKYVELASAGFKFTNSSTCSKHFLCETCMQQSCLFTSYHLQNTTSQYLFLTDPHQQQQLNIFNYFLPLFHQHIYPFCNISFLDSFFSSPGWN